MKNDVYITFDLFSEPQTQKFAKLCLYIFSMIKITIIAPVHIKYKTYYDYQE